MAHYEVRKGKRFIKVDKGDHIRLFGIQGCICVTDEKWSRIKEKLDEAKAIIKSELKPEEISQLCVV